jgi:hypothetical protein
VGKEGELLSLPLPLESLVHRLEWIQNVEGGPDLQVYVTSDVIGDVII